MPDSRFLAGLVRGELRFGLNQLTGGDDGCAMEFLQTLMIFSRHPQRSLGNGEFGLGGTVTRAQIQKRTDIDHPSIGQQFSMQGKRR